MKINDLKLEHVYRIIQICGVVSGNPVPENDAYLLPVEIYERLVERKGNFPKSGSDIVEYTLGTNLGQNSRIFFGIDYQGPETSIYKISLDTNRWGVAGQEQKAEENALKFWREIETYLRMVAEGENTTEDDLEARAYEAEARQHLKNLEGK